MEKDYKIWHGLKTFINNFKSRKLFNEREVWFCNLGMNIGFEQDGKGNDYLRPVIIIRKFNNEIFWAIPLTKAIKSGRYYYRLKFEATTWSFAILSQIRLIDSKRLKYKVGTIKAVDLVQIKTKLKQLLE